MVNDLTDLDADGNREFYKGTFYFTGQEFELETGLYNYKARTYDPKTGRFLQPDPVHTSKAGMDNFDRYQYVYNNPVNFTDPDGKRAQWTIDALAKPLRLAVKGMTGGIELTAKSGDWRNFTGNNTDNALKRASNGIENAGHTYSNLLFGKNHNCPTISECALSNANEFWSFVFKAAYLALAVVTMYVFATVILPVMVPAVIATGTTLTAKFIARGISLFFTGLFGLFFGTELGYLYGGLENTQLTRLNWDEKQAKAFSRAGAEIGFMVGTAMTGNLLLTAYNELAFRIGLQQVSKLGLATIANLSNMNYFSQTYWDNYKELTILDKFIKNSDLL